jgi:hypothetical protein
MFNFSANHLLLLSRREYRTCVVFLMQDDSTRRVYRLYDNNALRAAGRPPASVVVGLFVVLSVFGSAAYILCFYLK